MKLCGITKMKIDKEIINISALIFSFFLSVLLLKYLLYDNGFQFSNILLLAGLIYTRFNLFIKESTRRQEGACLILFILFDKSLLDPGNIFLLLGVVCIREYLHEELVTKEVASFICGLIYLLMGWLNTGRILVIYFLLMFYYFTIGCFCTTFLVITFMERLFRSSFSKLRS
ncbi:uncharacterized protein LOC131665379 [Phymastichus coffea]|uniref:uncharacterized protein LOC131665379 n=1 Tax=Phymastichus coffea TaxID=108790 RepID=UPI00273C0550|nr:uncharacterized protein LOC131665379 [Phymastichus coffea]